MVFGQNRFPARSHAGLNFSLFLVFQPEKGPKKAKIAKNSFSQRGARQGPTGRNPRFFTVRMRPGRVAGAPQRPPPGPAEIAQNKAKSYPPLGIFGDFPEKRPKGQKGACEAPCGSHLGDLTRLWQLFMLWEAVVGGGN